MESLINNFINGNLKDARSEAESFSLSQIRTALVDDYGYGFEKASLTAYYLKTGEGFQDACDAE